MIVVEETENLVLVLLQEVRKEQAEQRSVLLGVVDQMRRMDNDIRRLSDEMGGLGDEIRKMEQRLDARIWAVRDDLELMLKSELLGRLTHFETLIDKRLEQLSDSISARET